MLAMWIDYGKIPKGHACKIQS